MNLAWQNFWKHPKTTISGILGFIVAASLLLAAEPSLAVGIPPRWLAVFAGLAAVSKLILATLSKDTGREEAVDVLTGKTVMAASSEQPNAVNLLAVEQMKELDKGASQ